VGSGVWLSSFVKKRRKASRATVALKRPKITASIFLFDINNDVHKLEYALLARNGKLEAILFWPLLGSQP
jgi:hypothetical protein